MSKIKDVRLEDDDLLEISIGLSCQAGLIEAQIQSLDEESYPSSLHRVMYHARTAEEERQSLQRRLDRVRHVRAVITEAIFKNKISRA